MDVCVVVVVAGAYAMTLDIERAMPKVDVLQRMGKTWTLLQGLTLPIISYFDVRGSKSAAALSLVPLTLLCCD